MCLWLHGSVGGTGPQEPSAGKQKVPLRVPGQTGRSGDRQCFHVFKMDAQLASLDENTFIFTVILVLSLNHQLFQPVENVPSPLLFCSFFCSL